jgi:hypothetical protein
MHSVPLQNIPMRRHGKLNLWNDDRGTDLTYQRRVAKISATHQGIPPNGGRPMIVQSLSFDVQQGPNCNTRAQAVGANFPASSRRPQHLAMLAFALIWIGVTRADG